MSFDRLIKKIIETKNPSVAGLDPDIMQIPAFIRESAIREYGETFEAAEQMLIVFNTALIDALYDIVPAIKPQAAFYEMYGWHGVRALKYTIDYAKSLGMFVITDAKRGDIGSTMDAYAKGHLGTTKIGRSEHTAFGADALTVNAYLGSDAIAPLSEICKAQDKGVFVLCKTSNKSSGELQDIDVSGRTIYETMGDLCETWGEGTDSEYGYSHIGAVVGATYPQQLSDMRKRLPHTFFLVPGYGAQGAGAEDIEVSFDSRGLGGIVNASRSILCAYKKPEYSHLEPEEAARKECERMRKDIVGCLKRHKKWDYENMGVKNA